MSYCLKLLFFLFCVKQEADLAITARKFVYQKDMSEYCRRRVMPSVFLGRQVIAAYSQILHFSRLELPYSCFVSIRTESGSNIILVIQLMSDKSLIESCRDSKNQLLVYEIGETFGGYWGALPDNVMKPEPNKDDYRYTLKTTQSTTTTTTEESTTERRTKASTTEQSGDALNKHDDQLNYITVEVPIVNVSVELVPGSLSTDTVFDPEDSFDVMFDVTPGSGMDYQTTILPLVQFSLENVVVTPLHTSSVKGFSPGYQQDINAEVFTPDSRLTYPLPGSTTKKKQFGKYKYNANRRLNFKKNKQLLAEKEALIKKFPTQRPPFYLSRPSTLITRLHDFIEPRLQKDIELASNPWEAVDAILKNLSKTKDDVPKNTMKIDENVANLLHGLAKIRHNDSAFLVPNSSWYTRRPTSTLRPTRTKYRTDSITWRQPSANYRTNYLDEVEDTSKVEGLPQGASKSSNSLTTMNNNDSMINYDGRRLALLPLELDVDGVILNVTNKKDIENNTENKIIKPATLASEVSGISSPAITPKMSNNISNPAELASEISVTSTTATTPEMMKPMTLVDHESWENMVHAASVMAVMLNQSVTQPRVDDEKQGFNVTVSKPSNVSRRKKRYIHAIPIDHVKPHHLPVKVEVSSSTVHSDKISDAQEFQRLIELQDDEVHDRVALRYLRQYVGPALFNICDFDEAAAKHVYLFNSSRLVLAITNFTLERMTVVMTPARTLLTSEARCASAHLECQVSGARVCIDSLSACDGVPNCGSYDIYDEDRLTCGASAGLQHNVCLAAITFLAVLLTILYTVHYWLKRCVPKVSDAFFIYTDAAENVLYLDTIMRSPYDTEDGRDYSRGGHGIHDFMECTDMGIKPNTVSTYISRLYKLFGCKRKKRVTRDTVGDEINEEEFGSMHTGGPRLYSFGEVELGKMGSAFVSDAAVQTGSSLEINALENPTIKKRFMEFNSESDDIVAHYEGKRRSTDNRSILDLEMLSNQPSDELSILKFFRRARSVSMQVASTEEEIPKHIMPHSEEKEIQCLKYDHVDDHDHSEATNTAESDKKLEHSLVRKRLRFEETITMQSENEDDALEEEKAPERSRRSIVYGGSKHSRPDDTDSDKDADEPSGSTNREFKSYFWGGGKSKPKKPTKKKTQVSLR